MIIIFYEIMTVTHCKSTIIFRSVDFLITFSVRLVKEYSDMLNMKALIGIRSARGARGVKEFRYEDKNSEKVEKNSGNGN